MVVGLSSTEVQQNFGAALGRALGGEDVIIERYGVPRAVLMGYERYRALAAPEGGAQPRPAADAPESASERPARLGEPAAAYRVEPGQAPAPQPMRREAAGAGVDAGYRYVTIVPGVCGGQPIILGTRVSVRAIAGYLRLGMGVDEILAGLPHLTPAQVHEALSFYYDHREEIEREILEGEPARLIERYGLRVADDGRIVPAG